MTFLQMYLFYLGIAVTQNIISNQQSMAQIHKTKKKHQTPGNI